VFFGKWLVSPKRVENNTPICMTLDMVDGSQEVECRVCNSQFQKKKGQSVLTLASLIGCNIPLSYSTVKPLGKASEPILFSTLTSYDPRLSFFITLLLTVTSS